MAGLLGRKVQGVVSEPKADGYQWRPYYGTLGCIADGVVCLDDSSMGEPNEPPTLNYHFVDSRVIPLHRVLEIVPLLES